MFVVLDTPARNIERVQLRVSKGGHDVPAEKILARHARSLAQLPWFLDRSDLAWIFDNSAEAPRLVGRKMEGVVSIGADAPSAVREAVETSRQA